MNTKDLIRLGVPPGEPSRRGMEYIARYILKGLDKAKLAEDVEGVVRDPASFVDDELRGEFAKALTRCARTIREAPAPWQQWGEGLEPEAINQMGRACQLPVAVSGALMPDAHVGYCLPHETHRAGLAVARIGSAARAVNQSHRSRDAFWRWVHFQATART